MRPILGALLVLGILVPAGRPVPAEEPAAARSEVVRLPDGAQVRVVRGPGVRRQAEAPAPAPAPERPAVAVGGGTLWLLDGDGPLAACFVQRTSYVDGYRLRCIGR